jgi:uncharacterized membrane protein
MLYERHLRVGVAAQAILVVLASVGILADLESYLTVSSTLILSAVGVALPITLVGAVIPDLDESNSRVYRWFRPFVAVCVALYVFVLLYSSREMVIAGIQRYIRPASPDYLAGITTVSLAGLLSIAAYRFVTRLLDKLTHRQLFHQLPTGIFAGTVLYAEFVPFLAAVDAPRPPVTAVLFAAAFFVGFVSHLAADGLLLRRQTYIGKVLDEKF